MFWKVPQHTRVCSVLEGSSAYPGLLRSIRFLDILKVWKAPGERYFGIPAAARLRFFYVLEGSSAYPGLLCFGRFLSIPGLLRSIRFLDILNGRFIGIPATFQRFVHVLKGSPVYPGLLRSIRFLDILNVCYVSGERFFGIPAAARLRFLHALEGFSAYLDLLCFGRFLSIPGSAP